jgi:hypothetical protein
MDVQDIYGHMTNENQVEMLETLIRDMDMKEVSDALIKMKDEGDLEEIRLQIEAALDELQHKSTNSTEGGER